MKKIIKLFRRPSKVQPPCDGSSDPLKRCGFHHSTGLSNMFGGYDCCCGEPWLAQAGRDECLSGDRRGALVVDSGDGDA